MEYSESKYSSCRVRCGTFKASKRANRRIHKLSRFSKSVSALQPWSHSAVFCTHQILIVVNYQGANNFALPRKVLCWEQLCSNNILKLKLSNTHCFLPPLLWKVWITLTNYKHPARSPVEWASVGIILVSMHTFILSVSLFLLIRLIWSIYPQRSRSSASLHHFITHWLERFQRFTVVMKHDEQ